MIQDATSDIETNRSSDRSTGAGTGTDLNMDFDGALDMAERGSSRLVWMVLGAAIGMGIMYLIDPNEGGRRRQSLRQKSTDLGGRAFSYTSQRARDLASRAIRRSGSSAGSETTGTADTPAADISDEDRSSAASTTASTERSDYLQ
ncbi:MAG: hypothetical protein AB7G93_16310 [Bdellovibrionales bacterium]